MGLKLSKEEENEGDYLLQMHERGLHHILEVIFLSLPAEDICSCKLVSPEWRKMVEFYQNSPSKRAKNILQWQISQAWRDGSPKFVVSPNNFTRLIYKPSFGGPKTIAADDEHLAIAGLPVIHGQVTDGRIYVLNVLDLSLFKVSDQLMTISHSNNSIHFKKQVASSPSKLDTLHICFAAPLSNSKMIKLALRSLLHFSGHSNRVEEEFG